MSLAFPRSLVFLFVPCMLGGCAGRQVVVESRYSPTPPRGIVLVVDGAGGYQASPRAITAAVETARLPLYVRSFDWTLGDNLGVADMTDIAHARAQAHRLAEQVSWYRANYPTTPVYVIAHSAGTMVALESTQWLAPDSIERIVLLAPAVSADYDLRRALSTARQGIDVFTSRRDRLFLGLGTGVVGTADGKRGVPAAGRHGFDVPASTVNDVALASRLRQHPWDPNVNWTGNFGEHSGSLRPDFLKAYVLPLLSAPVHAAYQ